MKKRMSKRTRQGARAKDEMRKVEKGVQHRLCECASCLAKQHPIRQLSRLIHLTATGARTESPATTQQKHEQQQRQVCVCKSKVKLN